MTGLAHLGEDVGQLLALPLATDVCSQASLAELQRALVLADLQQFHAALLVRRVADDLADQVAHELGVLGLHLPDGIGMIWVRFVCVRNVHSTGYAFRKFVQSSNLTSKRTNDNRPIGCPKEYWTTLRTEESVFRMSENG